MNHYEVFDKVTGEVKGRRKTRRSARKLADRLDLEYGAIRYGVREVY